MDQKKGSFWTYHIAQWVYKMNVFTVQNIFPDNFYTFSIGKTLQIKLSK